MTKSTIFTATVAGVDKETPARRKIASRTLTTTFTTTTTKMPGVAIEIAIEEL